MTEQLTEKTDPLVSTEVREFVANVREQLADLDAEEQQELTAGLEADLTDLVAERGVEALGDPAAYARELRTAAGHPPTMGRRPGARGLRQALMEAIDSTHDTWDRVLDAISPALRGFLSSLQPAWWVLRAGVAWMVAQDVRGGGYVHFDAVWLAVLAGFVVASVQLGRRGWGFDRLLTASVLARLLLVGLNVFAVTMLPGAADRLAWHITEQRAWQLGWEQSYNETDFGSDTIVYQDAQICELQVRDESGRAIPNASVWDLTGDRPLPMTNENC